MAKTTTHLARNHRASLFSLVLLAGCGGVLGTPGTTAREAASPQRPLSDFVGIGTPFDGASLPLVTQLGIHRVRLDLKWSAFEPGHKGNFQWGAYDNFIGAAHANGIQLLGTLDYGNTWANHDRCNRADDNRPPDSFRDFTDYSKAVASHYDALYPGTIQEYEVWNEPNLAGRFWKHGQQYLIFGCTDGGNEDPGAFGNLVAQTVDAIASLPLSAQRLVAPGGTVFLNEPGFNRSGIDFMKDVFARNSGLAARLPAGAIHAYNAYPPVGEPESAGWAWGVQQVQLGAKISQTRDSWGSAGFNPGRPLWITEIGWPNKNGVQYSDQAAFLVRSVVLSALTGIDQIYIYTLKDSSQSDPNATDLVPEGNFGLIQVNGQPKMSYISLQALFRILGAYHVTRRVPAGDPNNSAYVVELASGGKVGYVAWDSAGNKGFRWTVPSGYRVFAMDGRQLSGTQFVLDGSPIYFVR